MAGGAILHSGMLELGLGQKIIMAFEAEGFACFHEKIFICTVMGIMAGETFTGLDRAVHDLVFGSDVVMTFVAQVFASLDDEPFVAGGMGIMTGKALAGSGGGMGKFRCGKEIVMTLEAEIFADFFEESFVVGLVRFVAFGAFAGIGRGMFNLGRGQKIIMALEADLLEGTFHFLGEFAFVAIAAGFVQERLVKVADLEGNWRNSWNRQARGLGLRAGWRCGDEDDIGATLRRNAIEKNGEELALGDRAAAGDQDETENGCESCCLGSFQINPLAKWQSEAGSGLLASESINTDFPGAILIGDEH
jgi:hypothetical protein